MANKGSLGTTLNAIPIKKELISFYYSTWENNNECLLFGNTKFKNLNNQQDWNFIYVNLKRYLIDKAILDEKYHNFTHTFAKTIWLTYTLFKDGKFMYPLSAHYNQRMDDIQIHPGASRALILSLFDNGTEVDTFFFSCYSGTVEKYPWLTNFKKLSEGDIIDLYNKEYEIIIVPDHGSFIPQITFNGGQTTFAGIEWHQKCREIIKSRKIYINQDIVELDIFLKTDNKIDADLIITIKNPLDNMDKIRLCILVFLNFEYEDSKFKIIPKNKELYKYNIIKLM